MPVHDFDPPERFVVGTVGPPGQRTFFLQALSGRRLVSMSCEKEQVQILADRVNDVLDQFAGEAAMTSPEDNDPLATPDRGRVPGGDALVGLGPQPRGGRHRGVRRRHPGAGEDEEEATDVPEEFLESMASRQSVRVVLSPPQARSFVRRARALVSAGRPPCPFCGGPLDPTGHVCPRSNGYKR